MQDFVREEGQPPVTSEQLVAQLREAILCGTLRPGDRLHQDRLAEEMGVSRTPLRTALTTLAQAGLVRYETNRGFRVREFSMSDLRHGLRVRAELEALACRLFALHITDAEVEHLHDLVRQGDALLACGTLRPETRVPYRQMNVEFHGAILRGAGNPWLQSFVEQLHSVPLVSDRIAIWEDYADVFRSHDDHRRIADALGQRDGERAARIMLEHVSFVGAGTLTRVSQFPDEFLPPAEAPGGPGARRRPS